MNYKNHIIKFWELNEKYQLGTNVIALFFFLIWYCEKKKIQRIVLSDREIIKNLGISRNSIRSSREKLVELNLLEINSKKGKPILYFFSGDQNHKKNFDEIEQENLELLEESGNIPSFQDFLNYAKTLPLYQDSLENDLKKKYIQWKNLGWKSAQGRPITDYRATLKATLPFLNSNLKIKMPSINRKLHQNKEL